jgi:hypothetical protein
MKFIFSLIILGITFYYADRKGFNPWAWILAAGLLGLIVLAFLPSASDPDLDIETLDKRRRNGTNVGLGISIACVVIGLTLILFVRFM